MHKMGAALHKHRESNLLVIRVMSKLPTQVLEDLFAALDRRDPESTVAVMSPDVVMVDEISRCWLRGKAAVASQIKAVLSAADSVQSRLSDLQIQPLGPQVMLVTGWLDQAYRLSGEEQIITAPLSACLQAHEDSWIVVSLHAIPLMDAKV